MKGEGVKLQGEEKRGCSSAVLVKDSERGELF